MSRKELIELCRYYKGEDENPFAGKDQNAMMFWSYEKMWCEMNHTALEDENSSAAAMIGNFISEYSAAGLLFYRATEDTPISLIALLYNRYEQWLQGTPDEFKEWYTRQYLKE